ncbi:RNA polymerase sigma factor [Sorangium sp. So ce854]|uniref:RNA polymerase sigma factor n=1 Tax=Sorangium sp. So ce854 TaxID=3133322 RepID=UPI003F630ABC
MAAITDEHFSFIARYLARLGVRSQDIDDVAQEVLAGAYRALPRFDPSRGSVRSWLMGIATHQASNHFRRAYRRRERLRPLDDLEALPDATPDSEQRAIARDRRGVLDKLLEEVPLERRCVFVAHEIEEIDMAEIAQQLSIPLSTAWSRHRLAWLDIEAAMRRWQARQRGRGLALIPFGAGALVEEARADRDAAGRLLAWLYRRARGALWSRRAAFAGGAPSRGGVAAALHAAAGVAVPLAGAAVSLAIVLGALHTAAPRAPAGQLAGAASAMAAVAPPSVAPPSADVAPPSADVAPLAADAAPLPAADAALSPAADAALSPAADAAPPPAAAAAADAERGGAAAGASAARARAGGEALSGRRAALRSSGGAAPPDAGARAAVARDQEIAAERALIDGAITAFTSGRRAEANRLLIEHRNRFPAGRLTAERNAALRALRASAAASPPSTGF